MDFTAPFFSLSVLSSSSQTPRYGIYIYTSCRLASLSGYDSFTTSHQPRILYIIIKSTVFFKRDSGKPVKCNIHIYLHNDRACLSPSEKVDSSSTWHILWEVAKGPVCPFSSNMLIEVYFAFPVHGRLVQQFVYCWVTLCLAVTIWGPVQPVDTTTVSVTSSRSHLVDHIWCFLQYKHLWTHAATQVHLTYWTQR